MREGIALDRLLRDRRQLFDTLLYVMEMCILTCVVQEVKFAGNDADRLQLLLESFGNRLRVCLFYQGISSGSTMRHAPGVTTFCVAYGSLYGFTPYSIGPVSSETGV